MKKTMMLVALMAAVASPAAAQRGAVLDPAAQERVKQLLQKLSQELQLQGGQPASDPLARYLYPPDLVMAHQDAIGLTDAQRTWIAQAALATQVSVMTTQSRLVSVTGQLSKALSVSKVDEASVLQ